MKKHTLYSLKQQCKSFKGWLLFLMIGVYLARLWTMPMVSHDEAQQLEYLQLIAQGLLPFRDFLDVYGPLNWLLPAWVYQTFGQTWLAVRIGVWVLQGITLFVLYHTVQQQSHRFYATLVVILSALLLGLPWSFHYSPYAFMQAYPLIAVILWVWTHPSHQQSPLWLAGTGFLISVLLLMKVTLGAFMFAAGIWGLWLKKSHSYKAWVGWVPLIIGLAFLGFTYPHYESYYFYTLTLPLLFAWYQSVHQSAQRHSHKPAMSESDSVWKEWGAYMGGTLVGLLGILGVLHLWGVTVPFLQNLIPLLSSLEYQQAYGDSEVLVNPALQVLQWGQWDSISLAVLLIWIVASEALKHRTFHQHRTFCWFFVTGVLLHHMGYPTPDLGHVLQDALIWLCLLGLGLYQLERGALLRGWVRHPFTVRRFNGLVVVCVAAPLGYATWTTPVSSNAFGEWPPHVAMEHLQSPALWEGTQSYYQSLEDVAAYLRPYQQPGDILWTLGADQLLNAYTGLASMGGEHRFLFYLVARGRISRAGVTSFVNIEQMALPQWIVDTLPRRSSNSHRVFSELPTLLSKHYEQVHTNTFFQVYRKLE